MTIHRLLWIPGVASIVLALSATANAQFIPASGSPFAVGLTPDAVAAGDFNGDGKLDLAIANQSDSTVTLLLGNGSGGFTPAPNSPLTVGLFPTFVAVADFNGDGKLDLAVANADNNNIMILLGNGTGGFTEAPGTPVRVDLWPYALAVGDFNGDGKWDLASANLNGNTVSSLLGNGAGGFVAAPNGLIPVGAGPTSVAVADFNGDGRPDLAVTDYRSNSLSVLLGNGVGGFTAAPGSPLTLAGGPDSVAAADFNSDGKPDLAIVNYNSNSITVLLGLGTGAFIAAPGSPFATGTSPTFIVTADFNGDGKPDLAVTNHDSASVTVLLGNGAAGFSAASGSPFASGVFPSSMTAADFNHDGKTDLAVVNTGPGNVSVLLNTTPNAHLIWENESTRQVTVNYFGGVEGAIFTGWNWLNSGGTPGWHVAAVADFDNNGTADLVWQNDTTGQVTVNYYGGLGGAVFQGWCYLNASNNVNWKVVGAADFDGNGVPDLIWQNPTTRQVTVNYYGGPQGCSFLNWNYLNAVGFPGWTVVGAADYDRNGVPDLIWQNDGTRQVTVNYYGGPGGATLLGWNWLNVVGAPGWKVTGASDFDSNGIPDLVWQNDTTGQVTVNYYGGPGGIGVIGWNWLDMIGEPGWHAMPSAKP